MSSGLPGEPTGAITAVRPGMKVVDAAGEGVGTVELVKMGDPHVATSGEHATSGGGLVAGLKAAFGGGGEPQVPDELASQLLRVGFVKVDGRGLLGRDVYVAAVQIRDVVQDVVHLGVSRTELLT